MMPKASRRDCGFLSQVIGPPAGREYTVGVRKCSLFLALVLAGCLSQPYPTAPEGRLSAPGTDQAWTEGHKLYDAACARCHGPEGLGLPGRGVSLVGLAASDAELRAFVRTGKVGHMPPRGGYPEPVLTERQLELILAHLRELQPQAAPAR